MNPDTFKLWSEIINIWIGVIQGCVTTVGILIAGVWSYYVFVRGRNFDPVIKIDINQKLPSVEIDGKKAAIITAKIKNIGKTIVGKDSCIMKIIPLMTDKNGQLLFTEETASTQEYKLLKNHSYLEPNEEVSEDVLVSIDKSPIIKIFIDFTGGYKNPFSSLFGSSRVGSSIDSIIATETQLFES